MNINETIKFILRNKDSLNPAVLKTVLNDLAAGDNKEEIELSVTENGTYTPDEGKVYKKVTVNVSVQPQPEPEPEPEPGE